MEHDPKRTKPNYSGNVAKIEDGMISVIEGNSGDSCRRNQHPVRECVIMGYEVPKY